METFTPDELRQIAELIGRAPISGKEALPVAILQQKIGKLLTPEPKDEKPEDEPKK